MNKIEFLAASLPYGLKVKLKNSYRKEEILPPIYDNFKLYMLGRGETRLFVPIIRHLDTLTQECVQADYNDGKPFIPIVELANMSFDFKNFKYIDGECVGSTGYEKVYFCLHKNGYFDSSYFKVKNQLQLFQLLLKFHFWPNKPEGEDVVYVTDKFNPYK